MANKKVVLLEANREGYGIDQIGYTMTVGELIDYLRSNFNEDQKIMVSNDRGYTYGSISENDFRECREEE